MSLQVVDPPTIVLDPSSEQNSPSHVMQGLTLNSPSVLGKRRGLEQLPDEPVWNIKQDLDQDLVGWVEV